MRQFRVFVCSSSILFACSASARSQDHTIFASIPAGAFVEGTDPFGGGLRVARR